MAITVFPVDNAPSYTGRHLRQPLSVFAGGGTPARPLGGFSAVRQGSGTVGTVTSTTWTITPHAGQLDLEAAAQASVYLYAIEDSSNTGSITAADASNARVDIVYLTLNDPAEGDGSGTPGVVAGYLAGTPGATPAPPATPARSMVLFTINVPKAGGGSPTITMQAPEITAGGVLCVRNQAQRDALTQFDGLRVFRLDLNCTETSDGTVWRGAMQSATLAASWSGYVHYVWEGQKVTVTYGVQRTTATGTLLAWDFLTVATGLPKCTDAVPAGATGLGQGLAASNGTQYAQFQHGVDPTYSGGTALTLQPRWVNQTIAANVWFSGSFSYFTA